MDSGASGVSPTYDAPLPCVLCFYVQKMRTVCGVFMASPATEASASGRWCSKSNKTNVEMHVVDFVARKITKMGSVGQQREVVNYKVVGRGLRRGNGVRE